MHVSVCWFCHEAAHFFFCNGKKKKEGTSSKCSGGTNFGIDPNERYIKKGDILSLVGKNCPRDIH